MQDKIKKQETLEEAAKKFYEDNIDQSNILQNIAEFGAKWQQEQIGNSEFLLNYLTISDAEARRLIFEQFKKK